MNSTALNRGKRYYELSKRLGTFNRCWFSVAKPERQEDTVYRYWADVRSQTDFSVFHALQPDIQWHSGNDSSSYRFGDSIGQVKNDDYPQLAWVVCMTGFKSIKKAPQLEASLAGHLITE